MSDAMTDERLEWFRLNIDHGVRLSAKLGAELIAEVDRLRAELKETDHALGVSMEAEAKMGEALAAYPSCATLAALIAALPMCQFGSGSCHERATRGTTSHEPEFCDEHAPANRYRDCDWAAIIRAQKDGAKS